MNVQLAERKIAEWATANAAALGMCPERIQASYIYNPGGFGNLSIRLTDGFSRLHVKLAPPYKRARLQQWAGVSDYLALQYSAPKLIHEINEEVVPGYPYGLVFENIEGAVPLAEIHSANEIRSAVMKIIAKLHLDEELRELLPVEATRSYAEAFEEEYLQRFTEDLDGIRESRELLKDFVSDETLTWFGEEIEKLRRIIRQTPAFQEAAVDAVHNDLNGNNVLVRGDGSFRIIDWDDLTGQGDAAMDYSVLLWPLADDPSWPNWREKVLAAAGDAVVERLELYFRAKLLDDVIDVLADYVEAEQVPEYRDEAQRNSKAIHLSSYLKYLAKYEANP
ncbi:aminoglycoside phosphotransferase family protein [Paenibacillus sp. ATY16]|uniref:aminoglycoside phosphotransferase family protein n=1 Tax=Paenibacillus sp. ATY16 TaxID=1759312 RepID=UPI00201031A5|nr:aminoglycoside phosphotransferase family protein [Paenibacillus sp. ATY16]MCK9861173.1 aminoglycoside phosphotransferase family protein [Paenibacillus sp. ATY16]